MKRSFKWHAEVDGVRALPVDAFWTSSAELAWFLLNRDGSMIIPGEIIHPPGSKDLEANVGLATSMIVVANTGDRPIQVGSHFHFYEVNTSLHFDRSSALGFRLNIPAGTAVRFEPGDTREVELVAFAGKREVYGLNNLVNGPLPA